MGSCSSQGQELNKDLERIKRNRLERQRIERIERERILNSKPLRIAVVSARPYSDPQWLTIELGGAASVRALLEKAAPLLGLDKSDAPSLQLKSSGAVLDPKLELNEAGLSDMTSCSVLGVEEIFVQKAKATSMDIVKAANEGRVADVQLVCQYASLKVNDQDSVLLLLHTHMVLICVCYFGSDRMHPQLFTKLQLATRWRLPNCW